MFNNKENPAFDIYEPNKQLPLGIVLETAIALQKFLKSWWPALLYLMVKPKDVPFMYYLLGAVAILISFCIYGLLSYMNINFYIDREKDEFILNKGILNKKKTIVQLTRIQQVNITQNFLQRLLKIYALKINTAGSNKDEVNIPAVSLKIANEFKETLLKGFKSYDEQFLDEGAALAEKNMAMMAISTGTLAKVSLTSNYLRNAAIIFAFILTTLDSLKSLIKYSEETEDQIYAFFEPSNLISVSIILSVLIVFVMIIFNLTWGMIRFYNYKIHFTETAMNFSFGLFNSKSSIIRYEKVQTLTTKTNYFQKKMNLFRVLISQASSEFHADKNAIIEVPGCTPQQKDFFFERVYNKVPVKGTEIAPNIRKLIPGILFGIIIPVLVFIIFMEIRNKTGYWIPACIYAFFAFIIVYIKYKNNRIFISDEFIMVQSGFWDITTEIIEPYKIQAITINQKLWHRKIGLQHITLHSAAEDINFSFGKCKTLNKYINQWLYQIETSSKSWM